MQPFCFQGIKLLTSVTLLTLVSCATLLDEKSSLRSQEAIAAHQDNTNQPTTASTGHLLSPAQVAKLTSLPLPIVAPTDLPQGFRVVSADGASTKLVNGNDDTGYSITYQGKDSTCFSIYSSQDGPRRLKQVGRVKSAVGDIKMYEASYKGRRSVQSFIPVKGNPVMISPAFQLNPATGRHEACKALDRIEYERILSSIDLLK